MLTLSSSSVKRATFVRFINPGQKKVILNAHVKSVIFNFQFSLLRFVLSFYSPGENIFVI